MRWQGRRQSENVEDGRRAGPVLAGGGGIGILVLALIVYLMGGNPQPLLNQARNQMQAPVEVDGQNELDPAQEEQVAFVKTILADTEDVWTKIFAENNQRYELPTLRLFTDQVESACGVAGAQTGPFYCPGDRKVYLDLSFFRDLEVRFKAAGEFPRAYVIAHEVGHHVQNLMGRTRWMDQQRARLSEIEYNDLSVRLELQADFFAGVWAHHMRSVLDENDIAQAMDAAAAIGDDQLQRDAGRRVRPESFTHGSSKQRQRWFYLGYTTGDLSKGDTFSAETL